LLGNDDSIKNYLSKTLLSFDGRLSSLPNRLLSLVVSVRPLKNRFFNVFYRDTILFVQMKKESSILIIRRFNFKFLLILLDQEDRAEEPNKNPPTPLFE